MPAYFIDTPQDEITDIVTINVNATLRVTYAILPGMVKRYDCPPFRRLYRLQVVQQTRPYPQYRLVCWFGTISHACYILGDKILLVHVHKCSCGRGGEGQHYG